MNYSWVVGLQTINFFFLFICTSWIFYNKYIIYVYIYSQKQITRALQKGMRVFGGEKAWQVGQLGWDLRTKLSIWDEAPLSPPPTHGLPRETFVKKKKCTQLFLFLITTCPVITIITYLRHLFNYSVTKCLLSTHCDARTIQDPVNPKDTDLTQGEPQT